MAEEEMNYDIALLVDGPNVYGLGYGKIKKAAEEFGVIRIAELFLDNLASSNLLNAVFYFGYRPVVCVKDVDTSLAVRAAEIICSPRYETIDLVVIASNDSDFLPIIYLAREYKSKDTLFIGSKNSSFSDALKNAADYYQELEEEMRNGGYR